MKKSIVSILFLCIFISLSFAGPAGAKGGPGGAPGGGKPHSRPEPSRPAPVRPSPDHGKNPPPKPAGSKPGDIPPSIQNFRGSRISTMDKDFAVLESFFSRKKNGRISITVRFNQSINPLSLAEQNIFINGTALKEKTNFIYNKKVDSVNFVLEAQEIENMEIRDIESFDGSKISMAKINLKEKQ